MSLRVDLLLPAPRAPITQKFKHGRHWGIDFGVKQEPIKCSRGGIVSQILVDHKDWGNAVEVDHGEIDGRWWRTWYAHLDQVWVVGGEKLKAKDYIGISGDTGIGGYHLHFGVKTALPKYGTFSWIDPEPCFVDELPGEQPEQKPDYNYTDDPSFSYRCSVCGKVATTWAHDIVVDKVRFGWWETTPVEATTRYGCDDHPVELGRIEYR